MSVLRAIRNGNGFQTFSRHIIHFQHFSGGVTYCTADIEFVMNVKFLIVSYYCDHWEKYVFLFFLLIFVYTFPAALHKFRKGKKKENFYEMWTRPTSVNSPLVWKLIYIVRVQILITLKVSKRAIIYDRITKILKYVLKTTAEITKKLILFMSNESPPAYAVTI